MLTSNRKQLVLMHPIRVDFGMKKHIKDDDNVAKNNYMTNNFVTLSDSWLENTGFVWDGVPFAIQRRYTKKWQQNLVEAYIKTRMFFLKTFSNNKKTKEEFFEMVKESMGELTPLDNKEKLALTEELDLLFKTKQKTLFDRFNLTKKVREAENILHVNNYLKYQEESDIINFVMKTQAGLAMIEISNFEFDIPSDVKEKMFKADDLKVFDNFYVLYMDPNFDNSKIKFTEEKKKDPIIFGVIYGSTKLYYIADWVTDYCKLTYEVLLKYNCDRKLDFDNSHEINLTK